MLANQFVSKLSQGRFSDTLIPLTGDVFGKPVFPLYKPVFLLYKPISPARITGLNSLKTCFLRLKSVNYAP